MLNAGDFYIRNVRVTPPLVDIMGTNRPICRVLQNKKYQNYRHGDTSIQRGGEYIIVLGPPREMTSTDDILENESHYCPRNIIEGTGWGNCTSSRENDGKADHKYQLFTSMNVKISDLRYRMKVLGHFKLMRYVIKGPRKPARKKKTRPTTNLNRC